MRPLRRVTIRPGYVAAMWIAAGIFVAGFLGYCAWSVRIGIDVQRDAPNITFFLMAGYALAAASCAATMLSVGGRRRRAWVVLAAANVLAFLNFPILMAGPGPSMVPWILVSAFVLVNGLSIAGLLLLLPGRLALQRPTSLILDALIITGSAFATVWVLVGRDVYEAAASTWHQRVLALSYPFLSIAALSLILFVMARTPREVRASLRLLTAGWLVLAVSMPVYSYLALRGEPRALYAGAGGAIIFLMFLVVAAARAVGEIEQRVAVAYKPSLLVAFAPLIPFAVAVPFVPLAAFLAHTFDPPLLVATAVVGGLVIARLALFLLEARRLHDQLEESMRFKGDMLRFISHEMGNPLLPLSVEAHMIEEAGLDPADPRAKRNVAMFLRSVKRLETLSRDVRDLTRVDAGHLQVQAREQDLRPLTAAAVQSASGLAASKAIRIRQDPPEGAVVAAVDAERYGQVVDNLLSNAVKLTPRGGAIDVGLELGPDRVVLCVSDTGAGLSSAQKDQLFIAFARPHGTTFPGLGLGLVICRAIVSAHGGLIWAESDGPDKGTRFFATFPTHAILSTKAAAVRLETPSLRRRSRLRIRSPF